MPTLKSLALAAATLALAVPALAASGDWRDDARPADMRRIARLDEAWRTALSEARAAGHGRELRALGPLADPRVALARPHPAPGAWRCRTIKLGSQNGGQPYVAYGWFRCRVELTPGGDLILAKTSGSQRQTGNLYPQGARRLVFLGAVAWGDERGPVAYGARPERDQVGVLERVGANRYRLALPWPRQESKLDLIELAK